MKRFLSLLGLAGVGMVFAAALFCDAAVLGFGQAVFMVALGIAMMGTNVLVACLRAFVASCVQKRSALRAERTLVYKRNAAYAVSSRRGVTRSVA